MITRDDVMRYAQAHGPEDAYNLLLLAGPDAFAGTYAQYEGLLAELEEAAL